MCRAAFRFYADLNDFLPPSQRQQAIDYPYQAPQSVKHLIEAAGIPHTEVELILANGTAVDFSYQVQDGDRIAVYPAFATPGLAPGLKLRPPLPQPPSFVLDIHLGQLARYLRLLGFDTLYPDHNHNDEELAQIAHDQRRILLTRDRGLLKRSIVTYGYCIRTRDPEAQLTAVIHRYRLLPHIQETPRCLRCNGTLRPVPKAEILHRLEPKTKKYYHEFQLCRDCEQIYWKGSHYEKIQQFIADIREQANAAETLRP